MWWDLKGWLSLFLTAGVVLLGLWVVDRTALPGWLKISIDLLVLLFVPGTWYVVYGHKHVR
jgi:hypothetical protein